MLSMSSLCGGLKIVKYILIHSDIWLDVIYKMFFTIALKCVYSIICASPFLFNFLCFLP